MHARGDLPASVDPDDLALATLAALQGGLLLAQVQRDTRPLEVALDAMLDRIQALTEAAGKPSPGWAESAQESGLPDPHGVR
ncbi:MAG TPA: hypothetical protein VGS06_44765 [Streptosporangiaceae bacterium]|nr:hypothetical protein [Streptosporangiaceae bacterium]